LVGETYYGTITNSYATGSVSGESDLGGLVGKNSFARGIVTNSYWDTETSGQTTSAGGTGKTTAQMMQQATFSGWDFTNNWWLSPGDTRPFLRSEYSTSISNAHQLQLMALDFTADYTLVADIDMAELGRASGLWNPTTGFAPVGFWYDGIDYHFFTGSFDGLDHAISGLIISRPTTDYVGLFSYVDGATISNVGLVDGSVIGQSVVGGLVGYSKNSIINKAYTTGTVGGDDYVGGLAGSLNDLSTVCYTYATGGVSGTNSLGGLVGASANSTVTMSYATGDISGRDRVGGLIGSVSDSVVNNAYATGAVTGGGGSQDYFYVGGLVGSNSAAISNSYATGRVTGSGDAFVGGLAGLNTGRISTSFAAGSASGYQVGGLVGQNASSEGTISNSYATGSVTGNYPGMSASGGLVGYNNSGATISNSYATGLVSVGAALGGLAGDSQGTITGSYWDKETTGQSVAAVNLSLPNSAKTTAEMRNLATFSNWDISAQGGETTIWRIYEGATAPLLRSFFTAAPTLTVTADGKVYDGTTALLGGSFILEDGFDNALVQDSAATYHADSKNVGTRGILMQGIYSNQNDYDLIISSSSAVDITRANLAVTGVGAENKEYDASTSATLNGTAVVSAFADDAVSVNGTGSGVFADKNVGTGKTVTVSGYTLGGADVGNYLIVQPAGVTANITPAPLTITADDKSREYGEANPALTASYNGFKGGDTASVVSGLTLNTAATTSSVVGDYTITAAGGTATNYPLSFNDGVLTITPVSSPPPPVIDPPPSSVNSFGEPLRASIDTVQELASSPNTGLDGGGHILNSGLDFVAVADLEALSPEEQKATGFRRVIVVNGGINLPLDARGQMKKDN